MKRELSNTNGLRTTIEFSDDGKLFNVKKTQDISGHLNFNKELAAMQGKKSKSECYNQVASIPAIVIVELQTKFGIDVYNPDHMPKLLKVLNSSDYKHLRTNEMHL